MVQVEPITTHNLEHVVDLLVERSGTMPEYTRWKYGGAGLDQFRGVVAYDGDNPLGCFGLVPRTLYVPDRGDIPCGWFADWFVPDRARGTGIGTRMLNALSEHCEVVIGHPGPKHASAICLKNGYRPLASFQRRRRLVFHPVAYERFRTKHPLKLASRLLLTLRHKVLFYAAAMTTPALAQAPDLTQMIYLSNVADYEAWVLAQPFPAEVDRHIGRWTEQDCTVIYANDRVKNTSERQRLVLHTSGAGVGSRAMWRAFVQHARAARCDFIDFFTTYPPLDRIWASLGAYPMPEAPILIRGLDDVPYDVLVHGWDRENWTNRSY